MRKCLTPDDCPHRRDRQRRLYRQGAARKPAHAARLHLFPVNPHKKSLFGIPAYESCARIPEKIDLAIIATPAQTVPAIVEECGKAGVEGAVIVSSGFREIGPDGEAREEEILELRKRYPMRIMGRIASAS